MAVDLTVVNEYLKTQLVGGINNQMWTDVYTLNRLKASNVGIKETGREVEVRLRMGGNNGVAQSDVIPKSGRTKHVVSTASLKKAYAFLEIDGDAIGYAPQDEELAFMGALVGETQSVIDTLEKNINISLFGKGDGVLGTVSSYAAGVITLDTPNMLWFDINQYIDARDSTTGALVGRYVITAVDPENSQITIDTTPIVGSLPSGGEYITNQYEYNNTIMGLNGIADDGTELDELQGVRASDWYLWRAKVNENGGVARALDKEMLDKMLIYGRRSGGFDMIITNENVFYEMAALLEDQRMIVNVTMLNGGFEGVKWGNKEIFVDYLAPKGKIFFVNSKYLEIRQLVGSENGMFNATRFIPLGKDGILIPVFETGEVELYKALLRVDCQLVTTKRNAHGKITDIQE